MIPDVLPEFAHLIADEANADASDPLQKTFAALALGTVLGDESAAILARESAERDAPVVEHYRKIAANEKENPVGRIIAETARAAGGERLEKRFRHANSVRMEKTAAGVIAEFDAKNICTCTYFEKSAPTTMQTETDNWGF
jgi:hypothetical protein